TRPTDLCHFRLDSDQEIRKSWPINDPKSEPRAGEKREQRNRRLRPGVGWRESASQGDVETVAPQRHHNPYNKGSHLADNTPLRRFVNRSLEEARRKRRARGSDF